MDESKPYHHGDLKQTLLNLALDVLERTGLEQLSLRALAQEAGVSKNAPYRHFTDKEALLRDVAAEGFALLADRMQNEASRSSEKDDLSPETAAMRRILNRYVSFARENPQLYKLMFSPIGYSLHSTRCRENANRAMSTMISCVEQARAAGWRSTVDPRALVLSFWSFGHGWAGMLTDGLIPEDIDFRPDDWLEAAMAFIEPEA